MKYKPWLGFTILGASITLDVLLGRTGLIFIAAMFAVVYWSQR